MTRKDKFRKYRQTAMIASVFIGALFLLQPSLPKYLSISFFSIGLVLLIWNSIGTFYYGKAAKALQTRDKAGYEKSMPYFEKALKWGVNEKCQIEGEDRIDWSNFTRSTYQQDFRTVSGVRTGF